MKLRKPIYENKYIAIFEDGTMGISDGIGYIDTMEPHEVDKMYRAIKRLKIKKQNRKPQSQREYEDVKNWIKSKGSIPSAFEAIAMDLNIKENIVIAICQYIEENEPGFFTDRRSAWFNKRRTQ